MYQLRQVCGEVSVEGNSVRDLYMKFIMRVAAVGILIPYMAAARIFYMHVFIESAVDVLHSYGILKITAFISIVLQGGDKRWQPKARRRR